MPSISITPSSLNAIGPSRIRDESGMNSGLEALENVCAALGGLTAWVTHYDAVGRGLVVVLDRACKIESELHSALEVMVNARPQGGVDVKPWKGDTLLCACTPARWGAGGRAYALGMLFAGRFELTERGAGVVDGLMCCLHAFFSRAPSGRHLNSPARITAHAVVCSCCRRTPSPQHGWIHWDDLCFIETGHACSHTVCDRCALELYEDVLNGKD